MAHLGVVLRVLEHPPQIITSYVADSARGRGRGRARTRARS